MRDLVFEGQVRSCEKHTYIIGEDAMAFNEWLRKQAINLEGKYIKLSIRVLDKKYN